MEIQLNRIIPIKNGDKYRMRCFNESKYSSDWILEVYEEYKFLWFKWNCWIPLESITNYGAGDTYHKFTVNKLHKESDDVVMFAGESELDFLNVEY